MSNVDRQCVCYAFGGTRCGVQVYFYLYQLADDALLKSETTAHSLAATLGFLGLYDDVQNEVLEQIVSVIGYDRDPVRAIVKAHSWAHCPIQVFEDYAKLDKVLAVFYEALRMVRKCCIRFDPNNEWPALKLIVNSCRSPFDPRGD
jgi:hypothetical protein